MRFVGLDVSVDEVAHVGLVRLEVEAFAAGLADGISDLDVVIELRLDMGNLADGVAGRFQLIDNVRVGANQRGGGFVERASLRFAVLQIGRDFGVSAEIMDVLQFALGRDDRLA